MRGGSYRAILTANRFRCCFRGNEWDRLQYRAYVGFRLNGAGKVGYWGDRAVHHRVGRRYGNKRDRTQQDVGFR